MMKELLTFGPTCKWVTIILRTIFSSLTSFRFYRSFSQNTFMTSEKNKQTNKKTANHNLNCIDDIFSSISNTSRERLVL